MILRKPYAFFIKHFKLFNIIITVLNIFVIYKLAFLFQFFWEYSNNPLGAVGQDLTGTLLSPTIFVAGIFIIILDALLLGVLHVKKKPTKLYIFNILINALVFVLLFISYYVLSTIELKIIENKVAYAMRDFFAIASILEFVIALFTCMRAVGFDIKKFGFGKDLEDLDIDVTDNEEFELQIDVDASKFKRNINRNKRYFKYFIYEHKFGIILVSTIIVALLSYFIYTKTGIYSSFTKVNKMVKTNDFVIGTTDSFITNKDYKGRIISNSNYIVVVRIRVKANSSKDILSTGRFSLVVGKNIYHHTTKYQENLVDFGISYNDDIITNEFSDYILVFEIPSSDIGKKKYLQYSDTNDKKVKFNVSTKNIDENNNIIINHVGESVKLNNNLMQNGEFIINSFEIENRFRINYQFCLTSNECYDSYEYIVPNYKSNYDKTILKINGTINLEKQNVKIDDLYDFISKFGSLVYTINGQTKRQTVSFAEVKPTKTKENDVFYIEVLEEVRDAESISLEFNLRNSKYVYVLK